MKYKSRNRPKNQSPVDHKDYSAATAKPINRLLGEIALIAFAIIIAYAHTLHAPFYLDDVTSIIENPAIHKPDDIQALWNFSPFRIVGYFTFSLNYYFHHLDPFGYHVVNIAIHFLAGISLLFLLKSLLLSPSSDIKNSNHTFSWLPLLAVLIFVLHPLQTQAVTYIVQRMASLAALFYILSLACFVQARLAKEHSRKATWVAACILAAFLAFFTKRNSVTIPLAIILVETLFFSRNATVLTKKFSLSIAAFTLFLGAGFFFFDLFPFSLHDLDMYSRETTMISRGEYLATQTKVLWVYLALFTWPVGLNIDHGFPLAHSFLEWKVLLAVFGHGILLITAFRIRKRHPLPAFGVFFYYLAHIVESSAIPIRDVLFEHRTYLPNLGLCIITSWILLNATKKWRLPALISTASILTALALTTWHRNNIYNEPVAFWKDSVQKAPGNARPRNNYGLELQKQSRLMEAAKQYQTALSLMPEFAEPHINLGKIALKQGDNHEALLHFQKALEIHPNDAKTHNNMGFVLQQQGKFAEAEEHLQEAIRLQPNYATAHANLGLLLQKKGALQMAIDSYEKALQYNSHFDFAHFSLGVIYASTDKPEKAAAHYHEALRLRPNSPQVYNNLGALFYSQKDYGKAIEYFSKALKLDATLPSAREGLEMARKNSLLPKND